MSQDSKPEFVYKWLSGWCVKRLLTNYPNLPTFYMGLEEKGPDFIYDVAYSSTEVLSIGAQVVEGMKLKKTTDVAFGGLYHQTAQSLYDMAVIQKKEFRIIDEGKFYRVRYYPAYDLDEKVETFNQWCERVMGGQPKDLKEKVEWYILYGGKTKE